MQKIWGEKPYRSLDWQLKNQFGEKVYKLALNGGMSCPNRDGKVGRGGCIFCSEGGSGDFAADGHLSVTEQIAEPVEGENGFYVVQMVSTFDRDATDQKKEEIIKDRKKELYDNKIAEWDTESFDINEKVWDKVTFEEIFTLKQEETERP